MCGHLCVCLCMCVMCIYIRTSLHVCFSLLNLSFTPNSTSTRVPPYAVYCVCVLMYCYALFVSGHASCNIRKFPFLTNVSYRTHTHTHTHKHTHTNIEPIHILVSTTPELPFAVFAYLPSVYVLRAVATLRSLSCTLPVLPQH